MENPLHILDTGTIKSGHGLQSNIRNGATHGKHLATLLSPTTVCVSENVNVSLLSEISEPILTSSCPSSQDGVPFHTDDPASLLQDKATNLLSSNFIPTSEYETVADVDVEKVDEWLKGRSDNACNSITFEFDSEMKATQEDIFPGDRSLLEDIHLNLTSKEQLVSVAELLGSEINPSVTVSKQKLSKTEVKHALSIPNSKQTKNNVLLSTLEISEEKDLSPQEIESGAAFSSPYIVDSSQLDLVEVSETQLELETNQVTSCQDGADEIPLEDQTSEIATVSIQPDSKDFVFISIKTGNTEQVFRVSSSMALDPNQALTFQNLITQPVILSQNDTITTIPAEPEVVLPDFEASQIDEPLTENVEVAPWIPSISRVRGKYFECPHSDCDMTFTKETKLRVHVLNHRTNRPHKCTFLDCDWSFNSEYRLRRHLISHMGKKNYVCKECNHCFTTKYNLKSHEVLHKRPENVLCPTPGCGKAFATRRKMEFHLKEHEEIDAPYKCPFVQCSKKFYSANYLASHLRVHKYSKEDLSCPIEGCGRTFIRICQLRQHMRQHTGERPYVCNFPKCGWKFSSASKLKRHVRKHTGERKYVCPEPGCNKCFMRPEHLKGHIIVHSGGRPFACEFPHCNSRFSAKSSLYVHMKKHTGDSAKAVFPCPVAGCTKKYNFKAHLRAHMLKIHASVLVGNNGTNSAVTETAMEPEEGDMEAAALDSIDDEENNQIGTISNDLNLVVTPSAEAVLESFAEGESVVDVPQLIIPDNIGQHLSPDLLALASGGQLTLTSDGNGQILINPADLLTAPVADQSAQALLSEMDQLLLGVEGGSPAVGANITASSPLDTDPVVLGAGPTVEVADGGSARTDYSSNLILSSRAKRRRQLQQQFRQDLESKCDADLPPLDESSGMLSAADVVLSSSSISLRDSEIAPALLHDDPPSTSDIYPDDTILPSLLNEPSTINPESEIFVVPTIHSINLSDLV